MNYKSVGMTRKPILYDRSKGWSGQTYQEAFDFCKSKTNNDGEGMKLCEYAAYCPLGEGTKPCGGSKEDVSWAPISNAQNHWVGLGTDAPCKEYTAVYPSEPLWGIMGNEHEEFTRNVMCCLDPEATSTTTPL